MRELRSTFYRVQPFQRLTARGRLARLLAMPTATQETSTPEWLTKQEAAKRLDLSPQRVLAMAKARQIGSKRERDPVTRQKIVLLHAGDVERICYDRDHPKPKAPLTKRENAVTEAVAAAKSNGDIASRSTPWKATLTGSMKSWESAVGSNSS